MSLSVKTPTISEIRKNIIKYLENFLENKILTEKRVPLGGIGCLENDTLKYIQCNIALKAEPTDPDETYKTEKVIHLGYIKTLEIPIKVELIVLRTSDTTTIMSVNGFF